MVVFAGWAGYGERARQRAQVHGEWGYVAMGAQRELGSEEGEDKNVKHYVHNPETWL